jgi:hypothetical protein
MRSADAVLCSAVTFQPWQRPARKLTGSAGRLNLAHAVLSKVPSWPNSAEGILLQFVISRRCAVQT